jgi:hypothetical protein
MSREEYTPKNTFESYGDDVPGYEHRLTDIDNVMDTLMHLDLSYSDYILNVKKFLGEEILVRTKLIIKKHCI